MLLKFRKENVIFVIDLNQKRLVSTRQEDKILEKMQTLLL